MFAAHGWLHGFDSIQIHNCRAVHAEEIFWGELGFKIRECLAQNVIRSPNGNKNVSWSVNVFWTGGYEDGCRWYGKLAEAMKVVRLPLVDTLLTLLFGVFAVAVKLAIVLRPPGEAEARPHP